MSGIVAGVTVALVLAMALSLYRVLAGPTVFDRLTGVGLIGTKSIIVLLLLGVRADRLDAFVDIALSYSLVTLVSTLVLARYLERRRGTR